MTCWMVGVLIKKGGPQAPNPLGVILEIEVGLALSFARAVALGRQREVRHA